MTVTWEPRVAYREANSTPMTPPPMIARREGTSGRDKMPVESTSAGLSWVPGSGGMAGTEPVAMMTWSEVKVVPSTVTRPGASRWPRPLMTVTPALRSVAATPATRPLTT